MLREGASMAPRMHIDAILQLADLDDKLLQDLERLEPFGYGNPEPIFQCVLQRASRPRVISKRHLRARFHDGEVAVDGIGFSLAAARHLLDHPFALAFAPRISNFQGQPRLELTIKDLKRAREALATDSDASLDALRSA
jgi:single-stranded-DNA-specific exonuclease